VRGPLCLGAEAKMNSLFLAGNDLVQAAGRIDYDGFEERAWTISRDAVLQPNHAITPGLIL